MTNYIGLGEFPEEEVRRILVALDKFGDDPLTCELWNTVNDRLSAGLNRANLLDGVRLPTKEELASLIDGDLDIEQQAINWLDNEGISPYDASRALARGKYEKAKELIRPLISGAGLTDARVCICAGILQTLAGICIYEDLKDRKEEE